MIIKEALCCRICKSPDLVTLLDLGVQQLSGFFPKEEHETLASFPLVLIKCNDFSGEGCGLVQLKYSCSVSILYGDNYGYRSGLNPSMLAHLKSLANKCIQLVNPKSGDFVLDIAGNDGSFLSFFPQDLLLLSVDPTSRKFSDLYLDHIFMLDDFFSEEIVSNFTSKKAKLITSFSVFYDLEDPVSFARDVAKILDKDGMWVFEQSYVGSMVEENSFDTICHEHLLYYSLKQIKIILEKVNLKLIDVFFTDTNGGSFCITASHHESAFPVNEKSIRSAELHEASLLLDKVRTWQNFHSRIDKNKEIFHQIIFHEHSQGRTIAGLGASTKGNILLNHWGITRNIIEVIGEVNVEKFGAFTPGTLIPIEEEDAVLAEYGTFVVLPWHFRKFFIENKKFAGKKLIFPLPTPTTAIL